MALGSTCGTAREAIDSLREKGKKVGLLKMRCFRPFPRESVIEALSPLKGIAVLDRSVSFGGFGGPLFTEVRSALYDAPSRPSIINFFYGLGGRDIYPEDIEKALERTEEVVKAGKIEQHIDYLGLRE